MERDCLYIDVNEKKIHEEKAVKSDSTRWLPPGDWDELDFPKRKTSIHGCEKLI